MSAFKDFIFNHWTEITLGIGNVVTYLATRKTNKKKENLSVEGSQIEIISENLKLYQTMIDDIEDRYKRTIQEYEQELESLREQIKLLRDELENC